MAESRSRSERCKFTEEEDILLSSAVSQFGCQHWSQVAARVPGRNARQCRERWTNYVSPEVRKLPWTRADDLLLEEKLMELGNTWQTIVSFFPGRSKNDIKNRWITKQRRLRRTRHQIEKEAPKTDDGFSIDKYFMPDERDGLLWNSIAAEYF
jgi:hypothetical protein